MSTKDKLKPIASIVRTREREIKMLGFAFFVLSLIGGIFWLSGKEIEPLVFVLGVVASTFWGLPHLANYIDPPRKKISEMNSKEILSFLLNTDSRSDWTQISTEEKIECYLREDPRLRFTHSYLDDGIQERHFKEKWANRHPDPSASGLWYDLLYDGNRIERFLLVSVDGHRAILPPPDLTTKKIKVLNYKVALINDQLGTCNEYIKRSKLEIENHT